MYATLTTSVELNDREQPEHNDWVDTYDLGAQAKQLFKCQLIKLAMDFAHDADLQPIEDFVRYLSAYVPKEPEPSYSEQAEDDAKELVRDYFMDEIIEQLINDGEASSDYNNDYDNGDSTFHEIIVDKDYSPKEALELLDDLYKHEEEDSGLWEGQDYRGVLSAKAAYTYGNAVGSEFQSLIEEINGIDVDDVKRDAAELLISKSILTAEERELLNEQEYDVVEFCEEYYAEPFENNVKEALQKEIEELL